MDSVGFSSTQITGRVSGEPERPYVKFKLLTPTQWQKVAEKLALTERERDVCELLFECKTRQEIAQELGIKTRTVRGYMEQIHSKLGVKNRVGVVLCIIKTRDEL